MVFASLLKSDLDIQTVSIRGSNPAFTNQEPSPNARKQLKVNKGQLRLYDTPGGAPFLSGIFISL